MSDSISPDPSVCLIMPAHNEEASIAPVIRNIKRLLPHYPLMVINDGSTDATKEIAGREGAQVLDLPFNLGIGGAVQTGLQYAFHHNFDIAIEIDADGQHDPVHVPALVNTLRQNPGVDMAIGSRFAGSRTYRSSRLRLLGIRTFTVLIRLVTGQTIHDPSSGFRAYSRRAIRFLHKTYPADFPEPDSIVMLLHSGYAVSEVPVLMINRLAGQSFIVNDLSLKAAYFVISNAIAILVRSIKVKRTHAR